MGPGKDTHGTLGPEQRGGRGWPTPTAQRAKRTCHDARSSESNTQVFRQTGWQDRRSKIECTFYFHFWEVFRLRDNVDLHASDHLCVNNTPTIVECERNTLSRVAEDVRMSCIGCWFFVLSKSWSSSQAQSFFMCRHHRLHRVSTSHHMLDRVASWPSRDSRISIVHHTALLMQTKHFSSLAQDFQCVATFILYLL